MMLLLNTFAKAASLELEGGKNICKDGCCGRECMKQGFEEGL